LAILRADVAAILTVFLVASTLPLLPSFYSVLLQPRQPDNMTDAAGSIEATDLTTAANDGPADNAPVESLTTTNKLSAAKESLVAKRARMEAIKAKAREGLSENRKALQQEENVRKRDAGAAAKQKYREDVAEFKLLKASDPDYERKRNWEYTAAEDERWNERLQQKQANKDHVAFQNYGDEAYKSYEREVKRMKKWTPEEVQARKFERLEAQYKRGMLSKSETEDGEIVYVDPQGRINTVVDEPYLCDHKPSQEAIDRAVDNAKKVCSLFP
jgi:pre-mRNA-splicing factor SYF2